MPIDNVVSVFESTKDMVEVPALCVTLFGVNEDTAKPAALIELTAKTRVKSAIKKTIELLFLMFCCNYRIITLYKLFGILE